MLVGFFKVQTAGGERYVMSTLAQARIAPSSSTPRIVCRPRERDGITTNCYM